MAGTELDVPTYTAMVKSSQQQQQPSYDSPQQEMPEYEMVRISKEQQLSSQHVAKSKEVVSSNIQHHSNGAGNDSNQKERVKWLIVSMLLITLSLLNVIVLITLFTKEMSCPQVSCPQVNTTQMVHEIAQTGYVSCGNTTDEMTLQQINTLIDTVGDNTQLFNGTIKNVTASLQQLITTQSILEDISIENKATINNVLVNVLKNQNESLIFSCLDIKNKYPNSTSGYYHINSQLVYCEMSELCNTTEGGWTRLAYLDMSDSTVDCPPGFKLYEDNGVRACGRPGSAGSCESVKFDTNDVSYSEVCGKVVGYQFGSPDAVDTRSISLETHNDINSYYVDGVSITYGDPRKHVWTMMSGVSSTIPDDGNCPCNDPPGGTQDVQSFIGNDYFCESGNPAQWSHTFYSNDPLWDGDGCGLQELQCCSVHPNLPWFHKTFNSSTTDYMELRVCAAQYPSNEDVPIGLYEIYVR